MFNEFTSYIDLAQVSLYIFWIFFAGLIVWLRREDRREGYPLEGDRTRRLGMANGLLLFPSPKLFLRPDGSEYWAPDFLRDERDMDAERSVESDGHPYEPTGNPLLSGVGPAAWVEREDEPELTREGHVAIVPMRAAPEYSISAGSDPIGWPVVGMDGEVAGTVVDIWIDRAEMQVRYLEVDLSHTDEVVDAEAHEEEEEEADDEAADVSEEADDADEESDEDDSDEDESDEDESDEDAEESHEDSDDGEDGSDDDDADDVDDSDEADSDEADSDEADSDEADSDEADSDESDEDEDEEPQRDQASVEEEEEEEEDDEEDEDYAEANIRLVPLNMAVIHSHNQTVEVRAVKAHQFALAPRLTRATQITVLEEEKIGAFFAGGRLYADPSRLGPIV